MEPVNWIRENLQSSSSYGTLATVVSAMRSRAKYILSLVILSLMALSAQTGWRYGFAPAGNFPGASLTVPLAVSLKHIVGEYQATDGIHAYVQTGNSFVKAEPPGSLESYLSGVNRRGVAVGGYCPKGCNPETGQYGYTFDLSSGSTKTLSFPMSGAATTAFGISDSGVIVGGYCPSSPVCPQGAFSPASHGFVDADGVFTTLDFPGAQDTSAFAINNAGAIVGFYIINNTGPHAFLYQGGTFTTIDFPGSGYTLATSINNHGIVAGLFSSSTGVHGFIYSKGTFAQIDRPGATSTGLTGMNDANELVGTWNPTVGEENFRAVPVTGSAQSSVAP